MKTKKDTTLTIRINSTDKKSLQQDAVKIGTTLTDLILSQICINPLEQ